MAVDLHFKKGWEVNDVERGGLIGLDCLDQPEFSYPSPSRAVSKPHTHIINDPPARLKS